MEPVWVADQPYANNFMARKIDSKILEIIEKYSKNTENPLKFMKRFLDDIFLIFTGSTRELHILLQKFNKIHPNIKFTMAHTTPQTENTKKPPCMCIPSASIPYLDTKCEIRGGQIKKDLYRKPTDKKQYLLTSSWHPIE